MIKTIVEFLLTTAAVTIVGLGVYIKGYSDGRGTGFGEGVVFMACQTLRAIDGDCSVEYAAGQTVIRRAR